MLSLRPLHSLVDLGFDRTFLPYCSSNTGVWNCEEVHRIPSSGVLVVDFDQVCYKTKIVLSNLSSFKHIVLETEPVLLFCVPVAVKIFGACCHYLGA